MGQDNPLNCKLSLGVFQLQRIYKLKIFSDLFIYLFFFFFIFLIERGDGIDIYKQCRWLLFTVNYRLANTSLLRTLAITDKIQIPGESYRGLIENDSRYCGLSLLQNYGHLVVNKEFCFV